VILSYSLAPQAWQAYFRGTVSDSLAAKWPLGPFVGFKGFGSTILARLILFAANTVLLTDSIAYFFQLWVRAFGRLISLGLNLWIAQSL